MDNDFDGSLGRAMSESYARKAGEDAQKDTAFLASLLLKAAGVSETFTDLLLTADPESIKALQRIAGKPTTG